MQEAEYKEETNVGEVVGKFIKKRKSYNIAFKIGVIISHKDIK